MIQLFCHSFSLRSLLLTLTTAGAKLYASATQKLTTKYNMSSDGLKLFLTQLGDRALFGGWTEILKNPLVPGAEPENLVNLISHHGMINDHEVRAHAALYYNTPTREAQDTHSAQKPRRRFRFVRRSTDGDTTYVSGTCLLKIIIADASIDTNATISSTIQSSKPKPTVVRIIPCLGCRRFKIGASRIRRPHQTQTTQCTSRSSH
jgi:hypothetical protein